MMPTVSLLISTYNNLDFLKLCLESVHTQTVLPDEVLIADDGSKDDTRIFLEELSRTFPVPIRHFWHEDDGFRKARICNVAIRESKCDYIIFTDCDIIEERHFIEDHLRLVRPGAFIIGSRVLVDESTTKIFLKQGRFDRDALKIPLSHRLNSLHVPILQSVLAPRLAVKVSRWRGCNMSMWRDDLIAVNGFDNRFTKWGNEDVDLIERLLRSGRRQLTLKFGAVGYHLWHPFNKPSDMSVIEERKREILSGARPVCCTDGIKQLTD